MIATGAVRARGDHDYRAKGGAGVISRGFPAKSIFTRRREGAERNTETYFSRPNGRIDLEPREMRPVISP